MTHPSRSRLLALAALVALAACVPTLGQASKPAVPADDLQTKAKEDSPKGAMYRFFLATESGDPAQFRAHYAATDKAERLAVEAAAAMFGPQLVAQAAAARFGDAAKAVFPANRDEIRRQAAVVEQMRFEIKGDTATAWFRTPDGQEHKNGVFRRVDGTWKADAARVLEDFRRVGRGRADLDMRYKIAEGAIYQAVAVEIAAGKYASAQDAKKALDARLAAYIASITAAPAATAPATSHPSTAPAAATAVPPPN